MEARSFLVAMYRYRGYYPDSLVSVLLLRFCLVGHESGVFITKIMRVGRSILTDPISDLVCLRPGCQEFDIHISVWQDEQEAEDDR